MVEITRLWNFGGNVNTKFIKKSDNFLIFLMTSRISCKQNSWVLGGKDSLGISIELYPSIGFSMKVLTSINVTVGVPLHPDMGISILFGYQWN